MWRYFKKLKRVIQMDGKAGMDKEWNLKKLGQPSFSSFDAMPSKPSKKNYHV